MCVRGGRYTFIHFSTLSSAASYMGGEWEYRGVEMSHGKIKIRIHICGEIISLIWSSKRECSVLYLSKN